MSRAALLEARGRVALIAGAGGGIGRATLELFEAAGARVVALDLDSAKLPAQSDAVLGIAGDAIDESAVRSAVECAVSRFGRIDFAVNAVGVAGGGVLCSTSLAEWRRVIDINLTSAFLLARECYRSLSRPGGSVVFIASTNARNGGSALSGAAYATAKAGIINLTRYLAREWAPEGLRVNSVMPGPVATPMLARFSQEQRAALVDSVPLKRLAQPAEVAAAIAFLCSQHAQSMSGACVNVSGGLVLD